MNDQTVAFTASLATPNLKLAGMGVANALGPRDKVTTGVTKVSGPDLHRVTDSVFETVRL